MLFRAAVQRGLIAYVDQQYSEKAINPAPAPTPAPLNGLGWGLSLARATPLKPETSLQAFLLDLLCWRWSPFAVSPFLCGAGGTWRSRGGARFSFNRRSTKHDRECRIPGMR